jgi:hypothetical protein
MGKADCFRLSDYRCHFYNRYAVGKSLAAELLFFQLRRFTGHPAPKTRTQNNRSKVPVIGLCPTMRKRAMVLTVLGADNEGTGKEFRETWNLVGGCPGT